MKEQTREEPKIVAAAERQMQAWARSQEIADRTRRVDPGLPCTGRLGQFIAVSREAGAGGGEIAELAGQKLGWEVLDKSLLDQMADRFRLSRPMLELVDENTADWAYDVLGAWLDRKIIPHGKYVAHLTRIVQAAARRGKVVLVGRGAQFLVPRDQGLAVRIIASPKYRLEQIIRRHGFDAAAARKFMVHLDRQRRDFVQQFFRRDINDPHLYDLVVNVERLGPEAAADLIVDAACR